MNCPYWPNMIRSHTSIAYCQYFNTKDIGYWQLKPIYWVPRPKAAEGERGQIKNLGLRRPLGLNEGTSRSIHMLSEKIEETTRKRDYTAETCTSVIMKGLTSEAYPYLILSRGTEFAPLTVYACPHEHLKHFLLHGLAQVIIDAPGNAEKALGRG